MVLAVIAMVTILAFIVSGYWVNSDFEVERQGMLQVSSVPTGADLEIDGESNWLQRTNTSKVLSSGEHMITLSKEGYDTWSKKVNISEGLLYRLHYPRLFLIDRTTEKALNTSNATLATISPDQNKLLLINDTTEWKLVNLNEESLEPKKLNISSYFSGTSLAEGASVGLFTGKIIHMDWNHDSNRILFKTETSGNTEWVLIDVDNPTNSLNLSKEFAANFSDIQILDNSASNLLAIQNGNLHKIDVSGKVISAVLAKGVINFDHYENEIVFSATDPKRGYMVGLTKLGDDKIAELTISTEPTKVTISKFYDEMYLTILQGDIVSLYKKADFNPVFTDFRLNFTPTNMKVGHNGEFITMSDSAKIATLDMEIGTIHEWQVAGDSFGWLDNDMIYTVADGELIVYDFDSLNRRVLAKNASDHFPATITDNKWLYYFSDGNLMREKITQ